MRRQPSVRQMWVIVVLVLGASQYGLGAGPAGDAPESPAMTRAATGRQTQANRNKIGDAGAQHRAPATRPAVAPATQPAASRPAAEGKTEVVACYFHRTLRCPSCLHIEATAKKVIERRFGSELKKGLLRWEAVDMQKAGNEHFATDFKLDAPSLVLVKTVNGRQASWKNCDKVWDLHKDEPAFEKYVQSEISKMLTGKDPAAARPARPPQKKGAH
jgi:hypothetical protein